MRQRVKTGGDEVPVADIRRRFACGLVHRAAGDAPFHAAAAHDSAAADDGVRYATGHFFSLHLRTRALAHLTAADQVERKKEHDRHALKRRSLEELRQGAPKGRQVLSAWDRAGIDFQQWHRWKHSGGLYFVIRQKENMRLAPIGDNAWDRTDPRHAGVLADELGATSQGGSVRRLRSHCVVRGEEFRFLTSEYTLPPRAPHLPRGPPRRQRPAGLTRAQFQKLNSRRTARCGGFFCWRPHGGLWGFRP